MIHIIDDEAGIRNILSMVMTRLGLDCLTFNSATEYLEHMKESSYVHPDMILSDLSMADMAGCDLAPIVKQQNPCTKFALMTGNLAKCTPECCAAKNRGHLIDRKFGKPFNMQELSQYVLN